MFNKILASCLFLLSVAYLSTPATAQPSSRLDKPPVVFASERLSTGEILTRAVVVGECLGNYKVAVSVGSSEVFDLSDMKLGQTKLFRTRWFPTPGEWTINVREVESMPSASCPQFPAGRFSIDSLVIYVTQDYRLENTARYAGLYKTYKGETFVTFDEFSSRAWVTMRLPGPAQTQIYAFQVFPNGTVAIESDLVSLNTLAIDFGTLSFSVGQMYTDKKIFFVTSSGGISTSGLIEKIKPQ